jgi:PAS domain S-box-containing protein
MPLPLALRAFLGLLLALVPTALVQIQLEREARQDRAAQLAEQASRMVRLVARQQNAIVEAARQLLSAIVAHEALRGITPGAECDGFLARIVEANPRYFTANLFDAQGLRVCASRPEALGASIADRGYFQAALREGRFQVGGFALGRATGERSLHFASPLPGTAGQPGGVAVIALSLDWLLRDLQSLPLPAGSSATIADGEGVILARSRDPGQFVGTRMAPFAMELLRAPAAGMIDAPALDGVRRIAAFIPPADEPSGLFVSVGLEAEPMLGAAVDADRRAALMIIGSLLLSFMAAILAFHAGIERPVQRLLGAAQRWARQDWRARVGPVGGSREFQRLAAAFDGMAEAIQAREAARLRATTRMRALQEVAPQIVITADGAGRVDWTNPYWRALTGQEDDATRGDGWLSALHPEDRAGAAAAWRAAVAEAQAGRQALFSREVLLFRAADESWRWFLLRGAPVRGPNRELIAWTAVGVDFHELREAQAAVAEAAARLQATYENAPVGLCLMDRELRFVAVNEMLARSNNASVPDHLGRTFGEMAPHVAAMIEPAMRRVLETGSPVGELEVRARDDEEGERFWLCNFFPVRGPGDAITGVSGAVLDITARKRIEASERLLSREVDHRAQNTLSIVRGLVRLSAADAPDNVPALVEVLEGRISAMSRAHNVLSREKWVAADLAEVVAAELAVHRGRTSIEGPAVRLTAEAAQPLTLVLHELVTNATKYGGLSVPEGRLAVRWERVATGVDLTWTERGGPRQAGAPARSGFGSQLINAHVRAQLAGSIERHWDAEGLRCVLHLGADALAGRGILPAEAEESALAGRRVLLAQDDPVAALSLATALRAAGCDVLGPVGSIEQAFALLEHSGAMDAAVLPGTLQGRSVQALAQLLQRRATTILYLSPLGIAPEELAAAAVLEPPVTARRLREALIAALLRRRAG